MVASEAAQTSLKPLHWVQTCLLYTSRIVNNYVVDFFYFSLINFPIFNVADIYVTVAAFMFIILGLFYYKEEDFSLIFPDKKHENR